MIYFDNSATTRYKPECVVNAVSNTLRHLSANPGRSGHTLAARAASLIYSARRNFADFLGCETEGVIFCHNCTDALNMAIMGSATDGGHIITTAYEHNSVLRPLHELKRLNRISLTVLLPNSRGVVTAEMVERAIRYNTYMIAINHVSNVTGAISPIEEIGRVANRHNIIFLVDGAQSVGYIPINMREQNIDMLAVAPHKGMHAAQGVGCLALAKGMAVAPIRFGGTGTSSLSPFQPTELPDALEAGTAPTPAIAGANAALKWCAENFRANNERLASLSRYFWERMEELRYKRGSTNAKSCREDLGCLKNDDFHNNEIRMYTEVGSLNGIFSFNVGNRSSAEVSNFLNEEYGICTRAGLHCAPLIHKYHATESQGMVRVSLSAENTTNEIDTLFTALKTLQNSSC